MADAGTPESALEGMPLPSMDACSSVVPPPPGYHSSCLLTSTRAACPPSAASRRCPSSGRRPGRHVRLGCSLMHLGCRGFQCSSRRREAPAPSSTSPLPGDPAVVEAPNTGREPGMPVICSSPTSCWVSTPLAGRPRTVVGWEAGTDWSNGARGTGRRVRDCLPRMGEGAH